MFGMLLGLASRPKQASGNACVKLCGFVKQCALSESTALRTFAHSKHTIWTLYEYYMNWNEHDQHRGMASVLDVVKNTTLGIADSDLQAEILVTLMTDAMRTVLRRSNRSSIKSALTFVAYFLDARVIFLCEVLATYSLVSRQPPDHTVSWSEFASHLFVWMGQDNITRSAAKLLVAGFSCSKSPDDSSRLSVDDWYDLLQQGLAFDIDLLEAIKLHVLMPLYDMNKPAAYEFITLLSKRINLETLNHASPDLDTTMWLAALEIGRKKGMVSEPGEVPVADNKHGHLQLQAAPEMLDRILSHPSRDVRTSAVAILFASPSPGKPLTETTMRLLQKHLPAFHSDVDPKFRYEVLGHERNLYKRISNARAEAAKKKSTDIAQQHSGFLDWYSSFLAAELAPSASYQRHITALKAMLGARNSMWAGQTPQGLAAAASSHYWDEGWRQLVMNLLLDPFDDVRSAAADLVEAETLEDFKASLTVQESINTQFDKFCTRANSLASRTARADHSDGVARSYRLLCYSATTTAAKIAIPWKILTALEPKLDAAETDLARAVLAAPIHGDFASLR
jgi:hypothetical protein